MLEQVFFNSCVIIAEAKQREAMRRERQAEDNEKMVRDAVKRKKV